TGRRSAAGDRQAPPPVPPAVPATQTPVEAKPEAPAPAPETDGSNPSFHFEGKRPFGGLTVYTPVRDRAGNNNSTRSSGGGGGLMGMLKWIGLAALVVVALVLLL
ncbi:MAG: hypothetical protein HY925_12545, partial [Elusimicrobia bacterium]|nr:hypothetical protein [Elusimicrobiota bacterium]